MGADRTKENIPGEKDFILNTGKSFSVNVNHKPPFPFLHLSLLLPHSTARVSNIGGNMERQRKHAQIVLPQSDWKVLEEC